MSHPGDAVLTAIGGAFTGAALLLVGAVHLDDPVAEAAWVAICVLFVLYASTLVDAIGS